MTSIEHRDYRDHREHREHREHLSLAPRRASLRTAVLLCVLSSSASTSQVWASPPDTVWVEDIHLHPSGPAELVTTYDYLHPDDETPGSEIDRITLRTSIGFDRAPMDFQPSIGFIQFGDSSALLDHVGLRTRYRLSGSHGQPRLALVFAYQTVLNAREKQHFIETDLAGRHRWGRSGLAWSFGIRQLASSQEYNVEAHLNAAFSNEFLIDYMHIAIETLVHIPLKGRRITDFGLGDDSEGVALYVGPTLRLNMEYLWIAGSVMSGSLYGDGTPYMVRTVIGTQF